MGRMKELYIKILEANNDKLPYNLTLSDVSKMKELDIYEWYAYNKAISKEMLENAFEYILPFRLGIIRIKKYKAHYKVDEETGKIIGNLSPNWKATKELWKDNEKAKSEKKLVYHTNEHSDGYQYKWYFSNYRSNCINKSAYCFIPSRTNKRELASLIKDEEFDGDFYM